MRLIVHRAADSDLDELYDSEDPTLEDMAAAIEVLLEEISNDPAFLCRVYRPNQLWLGEPSGDTDRIVSLWQCGYNILRLKVRDKGKTIPYRILYAFDGQNDVLHVLGILHRNTCYDKTHPQYHRVVSDYMSLGMPVYRQ